MLAAGNIEVTLGGRAVLRGASIDIPRHSLTAIIGPNGAGKSTLLKVLAGDVAPNSGRVTLDGRDLRSFSAEALAVERAVLSQATHLAFPFQVSEVVCLGASAIGRNLNRREREALAARALAETGMAGFEMRPFQELSGGEQQRVHLARVLCQIWVSRSENKPFLLLDEPVSSLDIRHQFAVLETVRRFADDGGGALVILHDINLASLFADRIAVMAGGRIVAAGAPRAVLTQGTIESAYGIRASITADPVSERPLMLLRRQHSDNSAGIIVD
ncbi:heme ABC transporter ATP-binding protein [soil metagenome]